MQYLGGKSRIAKALAEVIDRHRQPGQLVWDAFCGGLSMSVALSKKGPVWSTDACVPLISLYRAVQNGWEPPLRNPSREERDAALSLPDSDPMKAFLRVGCGFAGNWSSGLAVSGSRNYAAGSANALKRDVPGRLFAVVNFLAVDPQPTAAVLYLDPPYAGATPYAGAPPFDHSKFIERVRGWAQRTHVFVSEYSFPIGECIWERAQTTTVSRDKSKYSTAIERLYHLHPGTPGTCT